MEVIDSVSQDPSAPRHSVPTYNVILLRPNVNRNDRAANSLREPNKWAFDRNPTTNKGPIADRTS